MPNCRSQMLRDRKMLSPARRIGQVCCVLAFLLSSSLVTRAQSGPTAHDSLHQFDTSLQELVEKVAPSVVQIIVTGYAPLEEGSRSNADVVIGRQRSLGSGVIVDPAGYIVTNAHVVNAAQHVQVVVPPREENESPVHTLSGARGRIFDGRVIGVAPELDLALVKIDGQDLPALPIADYNKLRQGEFVMAFGSPEGLSNSVTSGVVSAVARQPDPDSPAIFIQTDAPINPGNSGGPLVNADGEVVGINTFILTESGGNEGLGFAVPSLLVSEAIPQLRKYGHVHPGELGIYLQTITPGLAAGLGLPRDFGVIVSDVEPNGPADKAGLRVGDIIVSADGKAVDSLPLMEIFLFRRTSGEHVKLGVLRGSDSLTLDVPVVERPHSIDLLAELVDPEKNLIPALGILGIPINQQTAPLLPPLRSSSGIIVAAHSAGTARIEIALQTGDVIYAINGTQVSDLTGIRTALDDLKPGAPVVLQIERDQKLMYLTSQTE